MISGAAKTIAGLKAMGLTVEILSGDLAGPVDRVARAVGLDASEWRAGLTPFEKSAAIDALKASGRRVLMVGDGLNDAAALARAHASMAPSAAVDAAQSAADLVFTGHALSGVIEAIATARTARRRPGGTRRGDLRSARPGAGGSARSRPPPR